VRGVAQARAIDELLVWNALPLRRPFAVMPIDLVNHLRRQLPA